MEYSEIDLILILVVGCSVLWGLFFGAVRLAVPMVLAVSTAWIGQTQGEIAARLIALGWPPLAGMALGVVGVLIGVSVATRLATVAIRAGGFGPLNHLLGVPAGALMGVLLAAGLVWGLGSLAGDSGRALLEGSTLSPMIQSAASELLAWGDELGRNLQPQPQPESEPWWRRPLW